MIQALTVVNERSTSYIHAAFIDKDGAEMVPEAVYYWINDEATGETLVEPTPVTPAASIEIRVQPEVNRVVADKSAEIHVATIRATYGDEDAMTTEVRWVLRRPRFLNIMA